MKEIFLSDMIVFYSAYLWGQYIHNGTICSLLNSYDRSLNTILTINNCSIQAQIIWEENYLISEIPSEYYTVNISPNAIRWEWTTQTSYSKHVYFNDTEIDNFSGHYRAKPEIVVDAPDYYAFGCYFYVSETLRIVNNAINEEITYLDISFPDIVDSNPDIVEIDNFHLSASQNLGGLI